MCRCQRLDMYPHPSQLRTFQKKSNHFRNPLSSTQAFPPQFMTTEEFSSALKTSKPPPWIFLSLNYAIFSRRSSQYPPLYRSH